MLNKTEVADQFKHALEAFYGAIGADTEAEKGYVAGVLLACMAGEVTLRLGPTMTRDILATLGESVDIAVIRHQVIFNA